MSTHTDTPEYLNFQEIKDNASVRTVLAKMGMLEELHEHGPELVGACPLGAPHGKKDSFAFNTEKKVFQCFACKAKGSLLDFVALWLGKEATVREAAHWVHHNTEQAAYVATKYGYDEREVADYLRKERKVTEGLERRFAAEEEQLRKEQARETAHIEPRKLGTAVMSFRLARNRVDKGLLNPDRLVVVDTELLDVLHALLRTHVKNN